MIGRAVVIVLAAIAVGVAAYRSLADNGASDRVSRTTGAADTAELTGAANPTTLHYVYSTNQEELLAPLIARFNEERHESDGRVIHVVGEGVASGEAERAIATGESEPVLWSPASSLWGRLLNHEVDSEWVPDESPALVRTPLVVALWKPAAEALGWPRKPIGFAQILELATSGSGWDEHGLPAFGDFKLGHTNPDFSTSGLSFVAAQYYTATGKIEGLTVEDVNRPGVRAQVRRIQQSIVHYGDTGDFFVEQLKKHGPAYVSAVAMEEVSLIEFNETRPESLLPLVAIYPAEGTFYFDNPLITLRAPWVTQAQADAATVFREWLLPRLTPAVAARHGYRPGDESARPLPPVDLAHLVDPTQPRRILSPPEPRVLATIKEAWHEDRKPANVAVVVDTSGSMAEEDKLNQVREGLRLFVDELSPRDRVALVRFSEGVQTLVPLDEVRRNRQTLLGTISQLSANGGTAVYDATRAGVHMIADLRDTTRINAVVVLTDGQDNRSATEPATLLAELEARAEDQGSNVRVFTIAYGSNANRGVLAQIADASGGNDYEGDPEDIEEVYRQISSYF